MQTPEPLPGFIFDIENPPVVHREQTDLGRWVNQGWIDIIPLLLNKLSKLKIHRLTVFNYKRNSIFIGFVRRIADLS